MRPMVDSNRLSHPEPLAHRAYCTDSEVLLPESHSNISQVLQVSG
jgi:hypothetical protein